MLYWGMSALNIRFSKMLGFVIGLLSKLLALMMLQMIWNEHLNYKHCFELLFIIHLKEKTTLFVQLVLIHMYLVE